MPQFKGKLPLLLVYLVLILSTLAVFRQVRSFQFVDYDDHIYVSENRHVSEGLNVDGIIWAFTTGHASNWHPLTWLSHMFDCQLFGLNPGRMHIINVFFHLANTLLLFALLRRMTGSLWRSAFVAAAFALHPMHVESVAWIAERKDVLSPFFMLLTLSAYVRYFNRNSRFFYVSALILYAAGLMAKPMLVTLPFLMLILDYWPLGRFDLGSGKIPNRQGRNGNSPYPVSKTLLGLIIEKLPFFVLSAASSVVAFLVQRSGGSVIAIEDLSIWYRIANVLLSYVRYLGRMFWPNNLAVFYPFHSESLSLINVAAAVIVLLVISVLVIRFGRKYRYLPVGWFWFLGTLVPVIGFVQVGVQSMADRYTYIPYIGLFMLIAWAVPDLLSSWQHSRIAIGMAATVVLAAFGISAHSQVSHWKDSVSLFTHAIEAVPDNHIAHNNRGVVYNEMGRWEEAAEDFRQAIRIKPDYGEAYNNLGNALASLGRLQEALDAQKRAIELKPGYAEARFNLGMTYIRLGRSEEAIESFRRALEISQTNPQLYYSIANEFAGLSLYDEAAQQYRIALRLYPNWPDCMNNLASIIATYPQLKDRNVDEAIDLALRACSATEYKNPVYVGTLAAAYAAAGRFLEAIDTANMALSLADVAGQPQLKKVIERHLSFYVQGKAYTVPGPALQTEPEKP